MKQRFEWLREEIEANSVDVSGADIIGAHRVRCLINTAESKWEKDCCEWWFDRTQKFWRCSCEEGQDYEVDAPNDNGYKFCSYCGRKIVEV